MPSPVRRVTRDKCRSVCCAGDVTHSAVTGMVFWNGGQLLVTFWTKILHLGPIYTVNALLEESAFIKTLQQLLCAVSWKVISKVSLSEENANIGVCLFGFECGNAWPDLEKGHLYQFICSAPCLATSYFSSLWFELQPQQGVVSALEPLSERIHKTKGGWSALISPGYAP